jgi:hypothetical protein
VHYHAEIYLENLEDVESQVAEIMEPYDENLAVEEYEEDGEVFSRNPNSFWDWYQIGGRWTGSHDDYDPTNDQKNLEICSLCEGTGFRNDELGIETRLNDPTYTCNGCGSYDYENKQWKDSGYGKGVRLKWATQWKRYDGDVCSIKNVKDDLGCATLIVNNQIYTEEEWNGTDWVKTDFDGKVKSKLNSLGITDGYLVTVDYHD